MSTAQKVSDLPASLQKIVGAFQMVRATLELRSIALHSNHWQCCAYSLLMMPACVLSTCTAGFITADKLPGDDWKGWSYLLSRRSAQT